MERKYMPDDKVQYVGARFGKELAGQMGWVISPIVGEPDQYVVEFSGEDYRMHSRLLAPYKEMPKKDDKGGEKIAGVEIRRNRRRASEEESAK